MSRYVEIVKDGNNYVINPNASGGSGIDFTTPIWMYNTGDVRENFIAFDINNQPVPLTQASDVDNVYGFLVQGDYEATPKYVYRTDPNYTPLCITGEYFDGYEWSDGNLRIQFEGSDVFIRWGIQFDKFSQLPFIQFFVDPA
jgi:hypothetical protein